MRDAFYARGIGVNPRGAISLHRIGGPGFLPQPIEDFHIFIGQIIAIIMRHLPIQPHGARRTIQIARHDIPADAPFSEVIQRGKPPRHQRRAFPGQVARHAKAKVARSRRHGRHNQHGIEQRHLHGIANSRIAIPAMHIINPQHIRQKQPVKQPFFQKPREAHPVFKREILRRPITRMRPHALLDMANTGHIKGI